MYSIQTSRSVRTSTRPSAFPAHERTARPSRPASVPSPPCGASVCYRLSLYRHVSRHVVTHACGRRYSTTSAVGPEHGFDQVRDGLGWATYQLTDAACFLRWWDLEVCRYPHVSVQIPIRAPAAPVLADTIGFAPPTPVLARAPAPQPPTWTDAASWKHHRNNVQLFLWSFICTCLLTACCRGYTATRLPAPSPRDWLGQTSAPT